MTLLGIAYPNTQDFLTQNRKWLLTRDKTDQIIGALSHAEDDTHIKGALYGKSEILFYGLYGSAFSKDGERPINQDDLSAIALAGPARLTSQFWGKYLFFCFDKAARKFICCADPSSQWTVYWSWDEQRGLLFSDSITCLYQTLADAGERPTWNTSFFTTWLRTGSVQSGAMPFERISEIPPGCALSYTHGCLPEVAPVWNPLAHARVDASQNPYEILKTYLSHYVSPTEQPVLELSGGLESSSVLLALRAVFPTQPLFCAHYYHGEIGSSNELTHARGVAQNTQAHLYEIDNRVLPFAPASSVPRVAKPHLRYCLLAAHQHFANQLNQQENSLLVNGHGGDSLFLAPPPCSTLADAALTLRWRRLIPIAMDLALLSRAPLAQVIQKAIKSFFSSSPQGKTRSTFNLLSEAAQQEPLDHKAYLHPFLQETKIRLPGKLYQLFLAFLALDDIRAPAYPFKKPIHYPFLCQPMVEFALSKPSYDHFEGAHNRIILRRAVSAATGYPHLWRRNKGETSGIGLLGIHQHKDHVMAMCLEGFLAREGYLNLSQVHTAIQESAKGRNDYFMDLFTIFALECFIQGWQ